MSNVTVVIGAGSIGQAIARRVSSGKRVLLADLEMANAEAAAKVSGHRLPTSSWRPAQRVPDLEARQFAARDGRGG